MGRRDHGMLAAFHPGEQGSRLRWPSFAARGSQQDQLPGDQKALPVQGFNRGSPRFRRKAQAELEERIVVLYTSAPRDFSRGFPASMASRPTPERSHLHFRRIDLRRHRPIVDANPHARKRGSGYEQAVETRSDINPHITLKFTEPPTGHKTL